MKLFISADCLLDAAEGGLQYLWHSSHPTMQTSLGLSCSSHLAAQHVLWPNVGRVTLIFLVQLTSCQLQLFLGERSYKHTALQVQAPTTHEDIELL